jgi:hypothetical protein
MTSHLQDVVWSLTLVVGLTLSVVWRVRLGRRFAPAVAGFATLLVVAAIHLFWRSARSEPDAVDLIVLVAAYAAYPAGLALLLVACVRRSATPTRSRQES